MIERDMFLLGATAVEDKLQEGVPDAIHTMQMAGIKVLSFYNFLGMVPHESLRRSGYSQATAKKLPLILVSPAASSAKA